MKRLELMRDNCKTARDLAMIDLLASSGMRVGELVTLNREDINFNERECVVIGKGNKERLVYFDARTKIHLQNYLEGRTDENPALFVSLKAPFGRFDDRRSGDTPSGTGKAPEHSEGSPSQVQTHTGYYCHRQRNAHRASPAALRASENRHHHALCNGETAECEAGT